MISRISRILVATLCVAILGGCSRSNAPPAALPADTVFRNGRIYTVDQTRSWAEAVAISDGRIVFVGSDADVDKYKGPATTVVNLHGRMMLPAFQDAHIHPIDSAIEMTGCNLFEAHGLAEYQTAIAECAAAHPDAPWLTGFGWSIADFGPGGVAHRSILDELVPDRPVYLVSADGHAGWANTRALEIAGINRDTPDPADGRIDRDPQTGEAIGSLQEEGARRLIEVHLPATPPEALRQGVLYAVELLNSYGITSVQDADAPTENLEAYAAMDKSGRLSLRVVASLPWDLERGEEQISDLIELRDRFDTGGRVRPTTVKIWQDGIMENFTAAMLEPYLVPGGTRGNWIIEPESLKRIVGLLDAEGFQVHFHAIGDAAVRQSLDAVEASIARNGRLGHRHHIAHLQIIDPADIPRFKALGVVANFQPLWAMADAPVTEMTLPFIGAARARWMYPIRSVQDAGGLIAFGSDWSVSTANPFPQIETAITRQDADGAPMPVFIPEERIDLETAIAAFTINAAFVNKQELDTGSIEVGKYADLIVIDQDLFAIEPQDISRTKVLLTLLEGKPVYGRLSDLQAK